MQGKNKADDGGMDYRKRMRLGSAFWEQVDKCMAASPLFIKYDLLHIRCYMDIAVGDDKELATVAPNPFEGLKLSSHKPLEDCELGKIT